MFASHCPVSQVPTPGCTERLQWGTKNKCQHLGLSPQIDLVWGGSLCIKVIQKKGICMAKSPKRSVE